MERCEVATAERDAAREELKASKQEIGVLQEQVRKRYPIALSLPTRVDDANSVCKECVTLHSEVPGWLL